MSDLQDSPKNKLLNFLSICEKGNDTGYSPPQEIGLKLLETSSYEMYSHLQDKIEDAIRNKDEELCLEYEKIILANMAITYICHCEAMKNLMTIMNMSI